VLPVISKHVDRQLKVSCHWKILRVYRKPFLQHYLPRLIFTSDTIRVGCFFCYLWCLHWSTRLISSEMKIPVFWDVTHCGSCKNRRFKGTYVFHHQDVNSQRRENLKFSEMFSPITVSLLASIVSIYWTPNALNSHLLEYPRFISIFSSYLML
jgi:hypothetical protein